MRVTTIPLLMYILLSFGQSTASDANIALGEEFTINKGQRVILKEEKLRIRFRKVSEDSRCPTGIVCPSAGNGEVVLEVVRKNDPHAVRVLNTLIEPREILYSGFKIRLVALNPYPKVNESIDQKDYEATLIVTRNSNY